VSEATRDLRALAQRIAAAYPEAPEQEIVVTGSVSRGVADEYSDLEILFSEAALRSEDECAEFGRAAGARVTDLWSGKDHVVLAGVAFGTPVELIWMPLDAIERRLGDILAAESLQHGELRTAEALEHGVTLRTAGRLVVWQRRLETYPEELRARLIETALNRWTSYVPEAYLNIVHRPDRLTLERNLVEASDLVLRMLFALNRRWEPSWKRIPELIDALPLKPDRTAERIEAALLEPDAPRALRMTLELARDALDLVDDLDLAAARAWLDDATALLR
jgi:hypothetical protein